MVDVLGAKKKKNLCNEKLHIGQELSHFPTLPWTNGLAIYILILFSGTQVRV